MTSFKAALRSSLNNRGLTSVAIVMLAAGISWLLPSDRDVHAQATAPRARYSTSAASDMARRRLVRFGGFAARHRRRICGR
jgi:hypothetical protein